MAILYFWVFHLFNVLINCNQVLAADATLKKSDLNGINFRSAAYDVGYCFYFNDAYQLAVILMLKI